MMGHQLICVPASGPSMLSGLSSNKRTPPNSLIVANVRKSNLNHVTHMVISQAVVLFFTLRLGLNQIRGFQFC